MNNWGQKAITLMTLTGKWDFANDCEVFVPFALDSLQRITDAYMALQVVFEDDYTARIKNATPSFLDDMAIDPQPMIDYISSHHKEVVFWREVTAEHHVFSHLLLALSSALIIPLTCNGKFRLLLLGWSTPQTFDASFREFIQLARLRIDHVLEQSRAHNLLTKSHERFTAIFNTMQQAVIFIDNSGFAGWTNESAARLLHLAEAGDHSPSELATAMGALRAKIINKEEVNRQAAAIFNNPDIIPDNWIWEIGEEGQVKRYKVTSQPLTAKLLNGSLWMFEELK